MSRFPFPLRMNPPCQAILIASIVSLLVAAPASAGIGGPLKKMKEKLGKATGQTAPQEASPEDQVVFDEEVVELTDARVENILAAFQKAHDAGAGRPALVEKLDKLNEERGKLWDKEGDAIRALQGKRSDVELCYHDGYMAAQDRRGEEYKNRALTDPALREKFMKAAQESNAAAARGDSAAIQKLNAVALSEILPTHEDSVRVRQSCGALPPHSAAEDRIDALDKQTAALQEEIRQIDEKVAAAQAEKGGLNREQWGMALERIQMYLWWSQSKSSSKQSPRGFSDDELKALEKHLQQLRAALG